MVKKKGNARILFGLILIGVLVLYGIFSVTQFYLIFEPEKIELEPQQKMMTENCIFMEWYNKDVKFYYFDTVPDYLMYGEMYGGGYVYGNIKIINVSEAIKQDDLMDTLNIADIVNIRAVSYSGMTVRKCRDRYYNGETIYAHPSYSHRDVRYLSDEEDDNMTFAREKYPDMVVIKQDILVCELDYHKVIVNNSIHICWDNKHDMP